MTRMRLAWCVFAVASLLAACSHDVPGPSVAGGQSRVLLTDGPFPYDRLARVDLFVASVSASLSADTSAGGAFVTLASPGRRFDILALQSGATAELGALKLPAGAISAVRMMIDTDSSSITLKDGRVLTGANGGIHWQSSAGRPVLNALVQEQILVPDTGAVIVIDFDVGQSFVASQELGSASADSSFTFMPVLRAVDARRTGVITGQVRSRTAGGAPVVDASLRLYRGMAGGAENTWSVFATGKTDAAGAFRLAYVSPSDLFTSGVWAGSTYILAVDPPSGANLARALVPAIEVSPVQTAAVGTVVLVDAGAPAPVASVTVIPDVLSLVASETAQLTAQAVDLAGTPLTGRTVVWSSSDTTVAGVSATGLVSARSQGAAIVVATVEGKSDTASVAVSPAPAPGAFSFSRELFGTPRTLSAWVSSANPATGLVMIGGADTRQPGTPFTFAWGDGTVTSGWFEHSHTYASTSRNYTVRVTAHYSGGIGDSLDFVVRFVRPQITVVAFPGTLAVTIPAQAPVLGSRQPGYLPPAGLVAFDDSYFGLGLPRADVEYVLSQAATVAAAIVENDMEPVDGGFRQVVLRDPVNQGAYSLWFTTPVAFGASGAFFQGTPGWSSLFHEMGHNFSLNAPAAFRLGGRIDGNANAVVSEALAQMFQHAVGFELVNHAARYGLPADLALDIANSARGSAQVVRSAYEAYLGAGRPFSTWNDPATPADETFGTFMTLARQFMVHAEAVQSYVEPLTRAMRLLRTFDQDLATQYAPQTNSAAAATFRATLMVAALSYGFQQDLRAEFRGLGFPVDDARFTALMASVP